MSVYTVYSFINQNVNIKKISICKKNGSTIKLSQKKKPKFTVQLKTQ